MIHTLKAHFPQCFDKNGDLMPHKLQEAILDLAQENQANLAQQSTTKQKDNANSTAQSDTAQDLQEQDSREKDAILSLSKETYTLNWLGKSYAKLLRHLPTDTLITQDLAHNAQPQHKDSKNVLIKGDNLEVLKHLKNAYYNKIKMIYIDPPYNTGNDGFIYNDERNFTPQSLAQMANIEIDEANKILNYTLKNSSTHSAWLSFMYPRLYIARRLLRDDGVIFISIDDNEQANLKILCDEIFGEENFVGDLIRETRRGGGFGTADLGITHDYILVYSKNRQYFNLNKIEKTNEEIKKYFTGLDKRGKFHKRDLRQPKNQAGKREQRPFMFFPFLHKDNVISLISQDEFNKIFNQTHKNFDDDFLANLERGYKQQGYDFILPLLNNNEFGRWSCGFDTAIKLIRQDDLFFDNDKIYIKERLNDDSAKKVITSLFLGSSIGNGEATTELGNILGDSMFDSPKPTSLIKQLLQISTTPNNPAFTGGGGGPRTPKRKLCA